MAHEFDPVLPQPGEVWGRNGSEMKVKILPETDSEMTYYEVALPTAVFTKIFSCESIPFEGTDG